MKRYIGTKIIHAEPEQRNEEPGYKVRYPDGYESWSPALAFNEAYRACDSMNFGLAIEALKKGYKVARRGWNGKGMWLVLVPGQAEVTLRDGTPYKSALPELNVCEILPHIDMWTVNAHGRRAMLPGWLASQTDMLSDDWEIIE